MHQGGGLGSALVILLSPACADHGTSDAPPQECQYRSAESRVLAIAASSSHTCAALSSCGALCWGENVRFQVGTTTSPLLAAPTWVAPGLALRQVALGGKHTCALGADGTVWCWGDNSFGELGRGRLYLEGSRVAPWLSMPAPVEGLPELAAEISAHADSCALLADGSVACWGSWKYDVLPTGIPERVPGVTDAVAVADGAGHGCALGRDGGVLCWGANWAGQLGDGLIGRDFSRNHALPVVGLPDRAVGLALAGAVSCAILESSEVACWGLGDDGILGNSGWSPHLTLGSNNQATPVKVAPLDSSSRGIGPGSALSGVAALDLDSTHACAALLDGSLACWGDGVFLPVTHGTTRTVPTPVRVPGIAGVVDVAVGFWYTCVLTEDQEIYCWGLNDSGQLGLGPGAPLFVDTPTRVDWRAALP